MGQVTIVGGGISGLIAAITAVEAGAKARVLEARSELGGRCRSTDGDFIANFGPRAIYADGPLWAWLEARRLLPPVAQPARFGTRFVLGDRMRRLPPRPLGAARKLRGAGAPFDLSLREWLSTNVGDEPARLLSTAAGFFTFDYDPGRLSAAFVWERMERLWKATGSPTRFPVGGFESLVHKLSAHARRIGVTIQCGVKVETLPARPVIIATELRDAADLLGDDLVAPGARSVLIDLGLKSRRRWPFAAVSLDEAAFAEHYSQRDHSLAPDGHSLIQAHAGVRPGEGIDAAAKRLEALFDVAFAGWRDRVVWRRRMINDGRSGAVDLPGTTWRDRPAISRGDGVWLAGDMVAAPGLLSEVALASATEAARQASAATLSRAARDGAGLGQGLRTRR